MLFMKYCWPEEHIRNSSNVPSEHKRFVRVEYWKVRYLTASSCNWHLLHNASSALEYSIRHCVWSGWMRAIMGLFIHVLSVILLHSSKATCTPRSLPRQPQRTRPSLQPGGTPPCGHPFLEIQTSTAMRTLRAVPRSILHRAQCRSSWVKKEVCRRLQIRHPWPESKYFLDLCYL